MIRRLATRRPLNPLLLRRVAHSNINKNVIARAAGFPAYSVFYTVLRNKEVIATPLRSQSSGSIISMAWADALIVIEKDSAGLEAGAHVDVLPL